MKNLIKRFLEWRKRCEQARVTRIADELFQVREYNGTLWFTFDNNLVCPATMFNGDMLENIETMRSMFLERVL